ncbi:MAG: SH3 domain-containing protein, partial [Burkholderiales bacterium]|nr:SH3 domain-containing protein [Anaerolineae bacterium]
PENVFTDVAVFSLVTETAETAFVAAYLAAARRVAELGDPLLAATAAQVAVVEAQHLALVRQIGGRLPNHVSLGVPWFTNVSDAVPVLQPFLEGGTGFEGPAAYPGAEAIRAVVGDKGVRAVAPFTAIGAEMAANMEAAASMTSSIAGTISSSASAVNVRSGPGTSFAVVTTVASGGAVDIMARNADSSWVMVSANGTSGWIAANLISASSDISSLAVQ